MDELDDILIAGGGPVGMALALALVGSGHAVRVLEASAATQPPRDFRPLALSYGSRLILERLGVWSALESTAITDIHVSQERGFGRVHLQAAEAGVPALGYVIDYGALVLGLHDALVRAGVPYHYDAAVKGVAADDESAVVTCQGSGREQAYRGRLVVMAEGSAGDTARGRTVDYHQMALTALVHTELPHRHTAYERFTTEGPLALLPAGAALGLVWTATTRHAEELYQLPDEVFLAALHARFGNRLGAFTSVSRRATFPLALRIGAEPKTARTVQIGNAAQTLHPVAGQGFNLGLRDAWDLAALARAESAQALGSPKMLRAFAIRRRPDRGTTIAMTDGLVRIFSNDFGPLRWARGLGLTALDIAPPVKNFLVRRMTFGLRG